MVKRRCTVAPLFRKGRKGGCEVKPANGFHLDGSELGLFDSVASELNEHAGTEICYYSQVLVKRDPVTSEPLERAWRKFKMFASFGHPGGGTPEMREEGFRVVWDGLVWIARSEFERVGAPPPQEGDVLHAWDVPFFDQYAVLGENVPNAGYFFDVIDVNDDGHVNDSAAFVQFELGTRRRTELTPERRVFGES